MKRLLELLKRIVKFILGPAVPGSIRSWRQARVDEKDLIWDRRKRAWKRREPLPGPVDDDIEITEVVEP